MPKGSALKKWRSQKIISGNKLPIQIIQAYNQNHNPLMFGLFKKKSEKEKLQVQYKKLTEEAHNLSQSNRRAADEKYAEAEAVAKRMEV